MGYQQGKVIRTRGLLQKESRRRTKHRTTNLTVAACFAQQLRSALQQVVFLGASTVLMPFHGWRRLNHAPLHLQQ